MLALKCQNLYIFIMKADPFVINAPAFLDLLPKSLAAKLSKTATLIKYNDGQMIHSRGDAKPGISIVKSGMAYVGAYGRDGSFVMTSILGPGQTFGEFTLFAGLPRTHDVTSVGETEVYQISAASFRQLYNNEPDISRALLSCSLVRTHLLLEMMDAIRRLPLTERTAKILLIMMQTAGKNLTFECRQSDLAFALGISRMSMSKALQKLSRLGLIELGYGEIRISDPEKLAIWVREQTDSS